ncbi:MAG TPA: hypothetical protein EYP55_07185 [Anaerolineae bacterium]|nr:hypothetical protein [Anaerolineae bacterium]
MAKAIPGIYKGEGLIQLERDLEGVRERQQVLVTVLPIPAHEPEGEASIEAAVSAVLETKAMVKIADTAWAREVAEDDSLLEWNLPL